LTLMLAGCASFFTKTPTAQDVSRSEMAIKDAAVIVAIQNPAWVPEMLRVSDAVVSGLNSGKITTLGDVQSIINQEAIDMHFSQKTIAYANLFMINITAIIQQNGQISLNIPVQICMAAQWVNSAIGGSAKCTQQLVTAPTGT